MCSKTDLPSSKQFGVDVITSENENRMVHVSVGANFYPAQYEKSAVEASDENISNMDVNDLGQIEVVVIVYIHYFANSQ
ncbi:unnamed protein product [Adineta ricciae]|uniref:Uncharacterized protein n=1 Tax=Adineta ricciae TaxID=249248 RepID=A0A813Z845_ADIRI|nr:unnamed protein product [Adineta ricciae]